MAFNNLQRLICHKTQSANLDPYLIMLNVKQCSNKYHFLSLWYDLTWDWTPDLLDHWQTLFSLDQWPGGDRIVVFKPFPKILELWEMQTTSSWISTWVTKTWLRHLYKICQPIRGALILLTLIWRGDSAIRRDPKGV